MKLIGQNKVILVGFVVPNCYSRGTPKTEIWQGVLSRGGNHVSWNELELNCDDLGSIPSRFRPICFKLQDNLYITGGSERFRETFTSEFLSCDRYNFAEGKYYKTKYSLPYPVFHPHSVVTHKKETAHNIY